jgi:DNA polymerase
MSDDRDNLLRAARQLVETDVSLGGQFVPASRNPLPAPAERTPSVSAGSNGPDPALTLGVRKNPPPVQWGSVPPLELDALPQSPADKAAALEAIKAVCQQCGLCQLGKTRRNLVFGEGNAAAELVFVGEAPGADEDATGRPFVGRAGQKLTEMIVAMGLTREAVYICNMLKCRPPDNRTPAPAEVQACWPFLIRQLQIIRPKAIITMGNPATQNLLQTIIGITKIRGQWQKLPNHAPGLADIPVMPTFHPSYLLRAYTPENRAAVWSDLQKVMALLGLKKP